MKHRIIMIGKNEFYFVLIHVIEGNMLAILIDVSASFYVNHCSLNLHLVTF